MFNDRPGGLGRNTERGATQWSLNPLIGYVFSFGRNISNLPPGIAVIGGGAGGAPTVQTVNQPANRYRLQLFLQAQNITNHANYIGYSGTMTSPFFSAADQRAGDAEDRYRDVVDVLNWVADRCVHGAFPGASFLAGD